MDALIITLLIAAAGTCLLIAGIETHRWWLVRYELPKPKPERPLPADDAEWLAILRAMNAAKADFAPAMTAPAAPTYVGRHRR